MTNTNATIENAPSPMPGENLEHYTIRAHQALMNEITDPAERNEAVWDAWQKVNGPTAGEQMAAKAFDPDKYELNRNQCEFAEHETIDGQGKLRKYDAKELAKITRSNNHRIEDVGAFTALSDRHTPNQGEPNPIDPNILGYVGPYRLGMAGNVNPKWAIFADEWHLKDAKPILDGKPRRSVELWSFKEPGKSPYIDPIAAIGAESPRLPLPTKFSVLHQRGATVERYTVAAPAFPGGCNTFTKKYANGESNVDEQVTQIMNALMQTPQMQFITQLMEQSAQPGPAQNPPVPEKNAAADAAAAAMPEKKDDASDLDALLAAAKPAPTAPPEKNAMAKTSQYDASKDIAAQVEKYAQLYNAHSMVVNELGRVTARVQQIERDKCDAQRTMQLSQLESQHPGFVDLAEEKAACLYSAGANMTDADFSKHLSQVEKYAQRAAPPQRMIPYGELPATHSVGVEKYEAALSAEAIKIHTAAVNAGDYTSNWQTAMTKAREKIKQ